MGGKLRGVITHLLQKVPVNGEQKLSPSTGTLAKEHWSFLQAPLPPPPLPFTPRLHPASPPCFDLASYQTLLRDRMAAAEGLGGLSSVQLRVLGEGVSGDSDLNIDYDWV